MQENNVAVNQDVLELLKILNSNGMKQAAENLEETIKYIDSMQDKLDEMINQVDEMRKELKIYSDLQNRSLGEKIKDEAALIRDKMVEAAREQIAKAEERIKRVKEVLGEAKEKFLDGVRDTLAAIKSRGKQGLNKLIGVTHIKDAFLFMKKDVELGINESEEAIKRLTDLGNDLRVANEIKKNALRSFVGKEAKEYEHEKDSLFSIITSAPWKWQKDTYSNIKSFLDKGIDKMERFADDVSKVEQKQSPVDEFAFAVAEKKQEYHFNDDAFEDYMKQSEANKIKPDSQKLPAPDKKPFKR